MSANDLSPSGSKAPADSNPPGSSGQINSISPSAKSSGLAIPSSHNRVRERRSSLSLGFDSLRHAGGVNSIDAFARSWTRAAGYFEITPSRQSYVSVSTRDEEDGVEQEQSALLDDEEEEITSERTHLHYAASSYGSLPRAGIPSARLDDGVVRHAADLFLEQQAAAEQPVDKEREPLLVKTVAREDGIVEQIIVGQSTLPQTVFNSVNLMIGIGLLSLPLGLRYSGWLFGMLFFFFSAVVTNYSAKLLARCLEKSPNQALVSYSDLAYIAFGQKSRIIVSVLFSLELLAACVALVVLFGDSLNVLIPSVSNTEWKLVAFVILTPLSFLPLRVLSFSSVIGILSTFSIFATIFINGLLKGETPGSLRMPAETHMFPENWLTLPLSLGLLMSPWGGHGVFPNIFKDMRHPHKYNKAVNITYGFAYLLDASMAVVGLVMFGDKVKDEITLNFLETSGYPETAKVAIVVFISIIPLTKTPLNARPIISTLEVFAGVDSRSPADPEGLVGTPGLNKGILRIVIRVLANAVFVALAILVPGFDRIMSFLGSALCFSICVILPILFYLKICGREVGRAERLVDWALVIVCAIMAIVGTIFTFIPNETLGA